MAPFIPFEIECKHADSYFGNDGPNEQPFGDGLQIYVDVDKDGKVTPDVDLVYGPTVASGYPRAVFLDSSGATRPAEGAPGAKIGAGFASTALETLPHRIWEVALPLSEIGAASGSTVRLGFVMISKRPEFWLANPSNLVVIRYVGTEGKNVYNFSDFLQVTLSGK